MKRLFLSLAVCGISASLASAQTTYFSDGFDSAASASNYSTLEGLDPVTGQSATIDFGFDYGTLSVPEAPNSSGGTATTGLYIQGNATGGDQTQFTAAAYVNNAAFSGGSAPGGELQVTVDYYYHVTGTTGTTEVGGLTFMSDGTKLNNLFSNDGNAARTGDTDGYSAFWVADYGFAAGDVGFLEGVPGTGAAPELDPADPEFTWGTFSSPAPPEATSTSANANGTADQPDQDFFQGIFGADDFMNTWITVRLSSVGGIISYEVDSGFGFQTVCQYNDPDDTFTSGTVGVSASDFFATSQTDTSYHIFDNLVVEEYVAPLDAKNWNLYQ